MVNATRASRQVTVTDDGRGVVSHVGALLVAELADRLGFTEALSAGMAHTRQRRSAHDPGVVLTHLAVMLVDGGDCLSDLAVLRDQPDLFGTVASNPTAWRVIDSIHVDGLEAMRTARAIARERAWAAGARPDEIVLDLDATLVTAHSEKEDAAPNYKHGFGFHPLHCYLHATGEALAAKLRPGNAGSNDAADHIEVLDAALAQLPGEVRAGHQPGDDTQATVEILVRTDSAGATHDFIDALIERDLRFSVGFALSDPVQQAILAVDETAWSPARNQTGEERDGADVVELDVALTGWPEDLRVICRRERPHPGAQFRFTDHNGYRFQCFITNQTDTDIAALEARHRQHAGVEDLIRCAKQTGLENFPFRDLVPNMAWLELVLAAQDLTAWTQLLCLDGPLRYAEPKKLRYTLLHVAARLARTARRTTVRVQHTWPWAHELVDAFTKLRALPI